jgi:hypothetical protein
VLPLQGRGHRFESDTVHMTSKQRVTIIFMDSNRIAETLEAPRIASDEREYWIIFHEEDRDESLPYGYRTIKTRKYRKEAILSITTEHLE